MLKRISAVSAAVAGALLIGTGARAASDGTGEPYSTGFERVERVVVVTYPSGGESWRRDAFPDPSPPTGIVQSQRRDSSLDSDMGRVYGRHSQPE